jgi:hypothetical protein
VEDGRIGARPFVLLLVVWAVFRGAQLSILGAGFGYDPNIYLSYARSWGAGAAPYAAFHPEYPPGALLLFIVPFLAGGFHYIEAFQAEMAIFDAVTFALVFAFARRLWPGNTARHVVVAAGYLVATAVLHPVLYWRYDLAPTALTLGALYLATTGRDSASAFCLGLSAAVKLWPAMLAPLWIGASARRRGWRGALRDAAWLAIGLAVPALLFVQRAGLGIFGFLHFQSERGLQLESIWANLALLLDAARVSATQITYDHNAFNVRGGSTGALLAVSRIALLVLTFGPQAMALRRQLAGAPDPAMRTWVDAATASVLGLLLGSSVLSPQFMIWIMPLLVLAGTAGVAAAIGAAAFTTAIYPSLYDSLVAPHSPGYGVALACLSARNLLLAVAYATLLRRLARDAPRNSGHGGKSDIGAVAT